MKLRFTKMHSLGNDFMVVDGITQKVNLEAKDIIKLADRHKGIGFDQCLIALSSTKKGIDFFYKIFNLDGSLVGQCANGARCLARFLQHYGLTTKTELNIATQTTQFKVQLVDNGVKVTFAEALFSPQNIPINFPHEQDKYPISLADNTIVSGHALSVGNPHLVILCDNIQEVKVDKFGREINNNAVFPKQVNVGFVELVDPKTIKLRVYERGCGETLACGSGAVAAAIVARKFYAYGPNIKVKLLGGDLEVYCKSPTHKAELTGPAHFVYEGILM